MTCAVGLIQLSFHIYQCVHPIQAKVYSIQMLLHFSQIGEDLHFSAFHFIWNYILVLLNLMIYVFFAYFILFLCYVHYSAYTVMGTNLREYNISWI